MSYNIKKRLGVDKRPKVKYVEQTIFNTEGVDVHFIKDGKDVRSDASLPPNYTSRRATKNASNVTDLKSNYLVNFLAMILKY